MKKAAAFLFFLVMMLRCLLRANRRYTEITKKTAPIKDSLRYVDALNRLGMLLYAKSNVDSAFYTEGMPVI